MKTSQGHDLMTIKKYYILFLLLLMWLSNSSNSSYILDYIIILYYLILYLALQSVTAFWTPAYTWTCLRFIMGAGWTQEVQVCKVTMLTASN